MAKNTSRASAKNVTQWSENDMQETFEASKNTNLSLRQLAEQFDVPRLNG